MKSVTVVPIPEPWLEELLRDFVRDPNSETLAKLQAISDDCDRIPIGCSINVGKVDCPFCRFQQSNTVSTPNICIVGWLLHCNKNTVLNVYQQGEVPIATLHMLALEILTEIDGAKES